MHEDIIVMWFRLLTEKMRDPNVQPWFEVLDNLAVNVL